ncbi:hypothetical protein D9M71_434120 [compost metagenome]
MTFWLNERPPVSLKRRFTPVRSTPYGLYMLSALRVMPVTGMAASSCSDLRSLYIASVRKVMLSVTLYEPEANSEVRSFGVSR